MLAALNWIFVFWPLLVFRANYTPLLCVECGNAGRQKTPATLRLRNYILALFKRMTSFITEYPQFVTVTNLEEKKLLKPDKYKDIIISSLRYLLVRE